MPKKYRKGCRIVITDDIEGKCSVGLKGDIVKTGNPLFIYIYALDKIIGLNQREQAKVEVFD